MIYTDIFFYFVKLNLKIEKYYFNMNIEKIYLHFVYNIHSFNQKSIWIRYARPDGALTFSEYPNNYKNYDELLSVSIIPTEIYETIIYFLFFHNHGHNGTHD